MKRHITIAAILVLMASCTGIPKSTVPEDNEPNIFPDYTDVVVPSNIAPLNFKIEEKGLKYVTVITGGSEKAVIGGKKVKIPAQKWEKIKKRGARLFHSGRSAAGYPAAFPRGLACPGQIRRGA